MTTPQTKQSDNKTLLFGDDIRTFQRFLKVSGLLKGPVDGTLGPQTETAAADLDQIYQTTKQQFGTLDIRTERAIRTLIPTAQELARRSLGIIQKAGVEARIISGTRSYREQDTLYRKGRSLPGPRVTNARGGQSNHNFGIAWDIGIFDAGGKYLSESPFYAKAGHIVTAAIPAIEWGGEWRSFPDVSHYQLRTGLSLAEIRRRFENGISFS